MNDQLLGLNCPGFDEAFKAFMAGVQKITDDWYRERFPTLTGPTMEFTTGPKYLKVIKKEPHSESVYCFVDRTNGDVLKGSWKAPVKNGVRGNILAPGGALDKVNWHGPIYLRR